MAGDVTQRCSTTTRGEACDRPVAFVDAKGTSWCLPCALIVERMEGARVALRMSGIPMTVGVQEALQKSQGAGLKAIDQRSP